MLLQLNPPIWLDTPKGRGLAHLVIDYGPDHDLLWTVFLKETGESWTFPNREIRYDRNATLGFGVPAWSRAAGEQHVSIPGAGSLARGSE